MHMGGGATCAAPRRRVARLAVAFSLVVAVAGCVEIDGELAGDGSLAFRYKYDPPAHATFKSETARLASSHGTA